MIAETIIVPAPILLPGAILSSKDNTGVEFRRMYNAIEHHGTCMYYIRAYMLPKKVLSNQSHVMRVATE
jgi:hypothetical protein